MKDHWKTLRNKIYRQEAIEKLVDKNKSNFTNIVFTNGCFDLLHQGHLHLLTQCRELGDCLIVGLNSDKSVRRLKGSSRPVNNEEFRSNILASLFFVDAVVIFDEDTPERLIELLKPNILVKGGDWKKDEIVGAQFVEKNGGKVVVIDLLKGHSTTDMIDIIKKN